MKINIGVCDDNTQVINIIKSAIANEFMTYHIETNIKMFTNYAELKESMSQQKYGLLFLDIKAPDTDGVEFAEQLRKENNDVDIIFISSKEERVFDTFKVKPFAFVRKSNFLMDISDVISRYVKTLKSAPIDQTVSFISHGTRINVSIKDIIYIEGTGVYQTVYFEDKNKAPIEISSRMETLENELKQFGFIRIHKGYLVNFFYINSIENSNELILNNGSTLPISRRKVAEVKTLFLKLCEQYDVLLF